MNGLAGAGGLLRLALRRDRVRIPVWTVVAAVTTAGAAAATAGVYPTAADRASAVAAINGVPALVALYGPVSQPTEGATAVFKLTMFGAAVVAVLTTLTVVRHTRADEESGRWELLRGAAVGRYAGLAAAGAALGATATGLGLGAALGLVLAGLPAGGSFVFGLGWTATGLVFGGFAAVMAQLSRGARAASEATLTMLVAAYLLRAAGDTAGPKWLSWLSPVGWPGLAEPYAGDRWWVLTLPLGTLVLAGVAAISLSRGRELGGGLVTTRHGADRAGRFLSGPVGLFWRLDRSAVLAWTMIFVALGLVAGSLAGSLGPFFATGQARRMIAALGGQQALTDAFLAAEFGVSGVLVSAFAIVLIGRLRTEEHAGRLAPLLAAPLSRRRLLSGSLVIVLAGTAIPLLLAGLGAGLVRGAREGDVGAELVRLSGASLVQLPAVWVLTGLALAVFGRAPRAGWFGWAALAAFLVLGEFGSLFHFPGWVWGISPYAHLPRLPGSAVPAGPLLWLAAVAVVLGGVGFAAFGRRDLTA